jgi:hypothetical protein
MEKDKSSRGACVVVVGEPGGTLVRTMTRWAGEARIDVAPCENVYTAVARMAGLGGRRVLVVGTMQELARDNGSFFPLAAARAVRCGCLLDGGRPVRCPTEPRPDPSRWGTRELVAALRAGATIVHDVQDLRSLLTEWLAAPGRPATPLPEQGTRPARRPASADALYEDCRATETELRALLE